MISQKCPKCLSKRVRRGYRPTPLWSKILFRYNLLCDNCNWEFVGFAVPGTVSAKPTKSPKKKQLNKPAESLNDQTANNSISNLRIEPTENLVSLELQKESAENLVSLENLAEPRVKNVRTKKKAKRNSQI